jgi:7-alpha-hydroxysteroid dehydrogenase
MGILDLFALDGDVAVVTGAGTGIGRAIAHGLADAGAAVVLAARREAMLHEVAGEITAGGGRALVVPTDVTDEERVERLVERVVEEFGVIDIWVYNAGGMQGEQPVLLRKHTSETFARIVELNLSSVWMCTAKAERALSDGGRVINVSSIAGMRNGAPFNGPYAASKAAINSLTQTFALEYSRRRIRVNAIAPGPTETNDLRETVGKHRSMEELARSVPLGRLGRDEDFGAAVVYLASAASDWVTGAVLVVAGGT